MKKLLGFALTLALLLAAPAPALAASSYQTELSLCRTDNVISVDCVFAVSGEGTITDVTLAGENWSREWNYVASEKQLYVAIASAEPFGQVKSLATVTSDGEITLTPVSVKVNGKTADTACLSHGSASAMKEIEPTCDKPGSTGGSTCSVCGAVLEESTVLPARGPQVTAKLSGGKLTVSGALTDDAETENTVLLAVYRADGRMLACVDISREPQNALHLVRDNMQSAKTVKIFRLGSDLIPCFDALSITVS